MASAPLAHFLTPNPALDLSGHVPRLVLDEKNYVQRARADPGGNGVNAARMAARLGAHAVALGFLGGETGGRLRELLRTGEPSGRLRLAFTSVRAATRINVTVTNDADQRQTRLTFPGPRVTSSDRSKLTRRVRAIRGPGLFVLGGSLPPGCSPDFAISILEIARRARQGVVIDVPALSLGAILRRLGGRPLLIKPNRSELEELVGRRLRDERAIAAAARELTDRVALVGVSLGSDGALLARRDRIWVARPPRVRARGSVGAGDSMVGAMTAMLLKRRILSPEAVDAATDDVVSEVLAWGMAAGAATVEAEGTRLGAARRVRELVRSVRVHARP